MWRKHWRMCQLMECKLFFFVCGVSTCFTYYKFCYVFWNTYCPKNMHPGTFFNCRRGLSESLLVDDDQWSFLPTVGPLLSGLISQCNHWGSCSIRAISLEGLSSLKEHGVGAWWRCKIFVNGLWLPGGNVLKVWSGPPPYVSHPSCHAGHVQGNLAFPRHWITCTWTMWRWAYGSACLSQKFAGAKRRAGEIGMAVTGQ